MSGKFIFLLFFGAYQRCRRSGIDGRYFLCFLFSFIFRYVQQRCRGSGIGGIFLFVLVLFSKDAGVLA